MIKLLLLSILLSSSNVQQSKLPEYLCIKGKRYLHTQQGLFPLKGKCKPTDEKLNGWDRD